MDVSAKPKEYNAGSEEQQSQSDASDDKPGLSQFRKSWGFRRSTLARREFMEEVGDLTNSPPPQRKIRGRRPPRTTLASKDSIAAQSPQESRTAVEDLEWSASSSPVPDETKPALASAGGCLDPSMWQDVGSAFHTAFSLLGGDDDLSMEMSQALPDSDILGVGTATEVPPAQTADDTVASELKGSADNVGTMQPVVSDEVAQEDVESVILISSQEEDSDDMHLIQIKEQLDHKARQDSTKGGGRGKARGRGRGRGKGKGRGRGRGRSKASEVVAIMANDEDDDDVILIHPSETVSVTTPSPAQQTSSDFIIVGTDVDQNSDTTLGQYSDAPDEEEGKQGDSIIKNVTEHSSLSDSTDYDPNALYCICRQKHNKRFMISCNGCQEYFHGDCVGVSESEGCQEYICSLCTTKQLSQLQPECNSHPEISPKSLSLSPSGEELEGEKEWHSVKKTVDLEVNHIAEVPAIRPVAGTEPERAMETGCSRPLCIGPGCSKPALQESVYCGTVCIVQHAALTMKSLSDTKVSNPRGQVQKKNTAVMPTAKGQSSSRVSARLAAKAEECAKEDELMETDGTQTEATSSLACDPTPQPSPKFYTPSSKECKVKAIETTQKPNSEEPSTDMCPSPHPVSEHVPQKSNPNVSTIESTISDTSVETTEESGASASPIRTKSGSCTASRSPTRLGSEHNETGTVLNSLATYIIPKKQSGLEPSSSHVGASCNKPVVPTLLNETRNLPVPPAPSAPSSRPSQPNHQVRQSIQRSLTSILSKRVCECEELTMSDSDAAKLVASIETEMFDIFRNTDSKYMNKYRTIMFNLKDPRNKGLLYRVVQGDISPFRLVRMSQKDMQATKVPDNSVKNTSQVKDGAAKTPSLMQQPEAVKVDLSCLHVTKPEAMKVDLPSLNVAKPDRRPVGNKRSQQTPILKSKINEPSKGSALSDALTCMLKDTTSEHKAHLFDLKCKICTGQIGENEPPNKKSKVSESSVKHFSRWRKSAGDDSPLRAPPDSPDSPDFSSPSIFDPSSRLVIDTSDFSVVESPASPVMDSPASPTLESPASPVMESPASPVSDASTTTTSKRTYTPVVIPAVSTVTITRRDPRTAASRSSASSFRTSGPTHTLKNQSAPYAPRTEDSSTSSSVPKLLVPPTKLLPKPILMKPSSSADPRLYGASSRNVISESPATGETSQFLAKQEVLWKGFLNMMTVSKFATKVYLVSGSAETLKLELPDTIEIGGRIMPQTVWDYVAKLKTNITKELSVIRFHPATEEEEVAYVSLFSYFSSRGRFGVVSNNSRSIKDVYLLPLSAKESIPSILQPLEGPGLEKNRPNLLLGLAIVQKTKRCGSVPQEIEEKKSKVLPKDPMWIPKPPVLYGSDKFEVFQPYDPETPASTTPPDSPLCPGSPSDSSSNAETRPSNLTSFQSSPTVSTSTLTASTQSTSSSVSDRNMQDPSVTPLSTILSTLFRNKQTTVMVSNEERCTTNVTTVSAKVSVLSHVSGSMMDPIVQQYGQKSKAKDIEEEYTFDPPYDPEEEYAPAIGYGTVSSQGKGNSHLENPPLSGVVDDDVAYDPEDETIFQDVHCDTKKPNQTKISNCPAPLFPVSTPVETPSLDKTPPQASTSVPQNLPSGTVVVSAATLTEQQRMLEELNKQIEEQKRQLKEQEEALRQQREAVGIFMAQFSVNDSSKSLPLSQVSTLQSGRTQSEPRPTESKDSKPEETNSLTDAVDGPDSEAQKGTNIIPCLNTSSITGQTEVSSIRNENENSSSAGEIEDSDVPYDPEDELFNEIQEDVFQGDTTTNQDSSLPRNYKSPISYHTRRHRSSPKKRSHRERGRCRSPSRRSHQRSASHSRKHREKDRHRKSERDRSKHRTRDHSERQARHRKSHSTRRHSHDRRRSPSSLTENDLMPQDPIEFRASPNITEKQMPAPFKCQLNPDVQFEHSDTLHTPLSVKNTSEECNLKPDSFDKDFTQEHVSSLKLETSHQLESNEPLNTNDSDMVNSVARPSQMNKELGTSAATCESSIPLRVLDPPIRDSPESPDPDPQFVEPSGVENNPSATSHEIKDCQTQLSNLTSAVEVENDFQHSVSQATLLNIPPNFEGTSNVANLIFRALNIQRSDSREGNTTKMEGEGKHLDQKHSQILTQGGGPLNPAVETNTSLIPEMSHVLKCSRPGSDLKQDNDVPRLKVDENISQSEQLSSKPGVMVIGGSQNQGNASELKIKDCDPSIKSKIAPQVKDVQEYGRDVDLNIRQCDLESNLKLNVSTYSDDRYLRTASSDENRKLEKREAACTRRPGPTVNYGRFQSRISYTGKDNVGTAHHFKKAHYDIKFESSVHRLDMTVSENLHGRKTHDVIEMSSFGPGQAVAGMGGQGFGHRVDAHIPDRGSGETLTESNYANIQGKNEHDQCPERSNDNNGPQDQCVISNIIKADLLTTKISTGDHSSQNMELFECKTYVDWNCPESIGDSVRIRQHRQDEGKMHQPLWRGTAMESYGPEKRVTCGVDPCKSLVEMGVPNVGLTKHDRRGPGVSDVTGQREETLYPDLKLPIHDRRGPSGLDFTIPGADVRGPIMPNWNGRETDARIPLHDRRGPGVRDFRTQEPNFGNPALVDGALGMKPLGPDLREPRSEKKHLAISGYDVRGPSVPDHLGSYFERGLTREGPGGGQGPDGNEPAMEYPRINAKDFAGSLFRGAGNERRELSINSPGVDRNRSEYPDSSGSEPGRGEIRLPVFTGPHLERKRGSDRREHVFKRNSIKGQVPPASWGDQHTDELDLDRLRPRGPAWDPQSETGNKSMEIALPDWRRPDVRRPGPERNPPRPDNRRHQAFMEHRMVEARIPNRPEDQHLGPNTERPGHERRHPDRQEPRYSSVFLESRDTDHPFGGPGPDEILPHQIRNPTLEGLGPDRRQPEDCDFRNMTFERDPAGLNWRENGPSFMGTGNRQTNRSGRDSAEDQRHRRKCDFESSYQAEWKATDCRYPSPDRSDIDAEKHWSDRHKIEFRNDWNRQDNRFPQPIPEDIEAQVFEYNIGGAFRAQGGLGVRERGHIPDRTPMLSGSWRVPEDDWNGPDWRDPRPFHDNADTVFSMPDRVGPVNDCRETDRGDADPRWGSETMGYRQQGHDRELPATGVLGSDSMGFQEAERQLRRTRGQSMERPRPTHGVHYKNNSFQNRREEKMQVSPEQRRISDTDVRYGENLYVERPVSDVRNLPPRAIEREREGLEVKGPTPGGQEYDTVFRRQDSDIRRLFHDKMDMRGAPDLPRLGHEPSLWDTDTENPVWNRRGEDKMGPFSDSREPDPSMKDGMKISDIRDSRQCHNRHNRRGLHMRGRSLRQKYQAGCGPHRVNRGSLENPQSQQEIKIPKPRTALLPTPTEGRIFLPNHRMSNPNMLTKTKPNRPPR
ncbi:uncharacterized protein LOC127595506 isoform X1 [Hippocampus zosterae]|uniref:uncharacterized protein LOC127595506 isoform X1 n=1 Tax=Hippocampus zosterae TaxID=109293 RepID=UPI00223E2069|nr:uncharacterized protein LOC127595506 isoform X1 [Hippocampus zosterae]XP_051913015.1 uncharacterized protein LOC127595506 isoform X1 [Hippocampus zosterae]